MRNRRAANFLGFMLTLALFLFPASGAWALEGADDGEIIAKEIPLSKFTTQQKDGKTVATTRYDAPKSGKKKRYIRVEFDQLTLGAGDELVVSGLNMGAAGTLNGQSFKGPMTIDKPMMTGLIYGAFATITLTTSDINAVRLHIKRFIHQQLPADLQLSIYEPDGDGRLDFTKVTDPILKSVGGSVIFLAYVDGLTPRVCTGFVISPNTVMTNDHCVNNAAKCASATIVFDYLSRGGDSIVMGQQRGCTAVKDNSEALDFAVLELDQPVATSVAPIALYETDSAPGVQTFLLQHPGGEYKQVSEIGCQPIDVGVPGMDPAQATDFTHRCDTLGGSSGSPVLVAVGSGNTKHYCVTGLHHLGFEDGTEFATKNRAVKISLIAGKLKEKAIQYTPCGN